MSSNFNHSAAGRSTWKTRGAMLLGALVLGLGAVGCTATVTPQPVAVSYGVDLGVPVVAASTVPTNISAYPRVAYRGSYAYYVEGAWYYPTARGWVVLQEEPAPLATYRTRYIRTAPRYYRPAPAYPAYPRERPREYDRYRRY